MKNITYNGETHTLKEWIEILNLSENSQLVDYKDLIDFAKELVFNGKITNENLYKAYSLWNLGQHILSPSVFAKRISIIFKEYRPDLQQFRTCDTRGWQTTV